MKCRHCGGPLDPQQDVFIDLGTAPPSNAFLRPQDLLLPEAYFPLKALVCRGCRLVQIDEVARRDALFSSDYVYFSSYSRSWLAHAHRFVQQAVERLSLNADSKVMEIASNDGYLLQYVKERGIGCVGIEPTQSTAAAARARGIETIGEFFGAAFADGWVEQRGRADLVIGNNVLAHVPDINDFVAGLRRVLAPTGCLTLEFPHLLRLVRDTQFDTIYHEHFSYLSFHTVERILERAGLMAWDVEKLPTHGGSLRVWAQHERAGRPVAARVLDLRRDEAAAGVTEPAFYRGLQAAAERIRDDLLLFLIDCKRSGRQVVGYGAAAKGNTLLNFAGVKSDLLAYVADASPHKQGRFLPGSRIPVLEPAAIDASRPDFILLLPWNLREELVAQLAHARNWGARFATAIPSLQIA